MFRGKLGYVLGKLFSRIATDDLSGKEDVVTKFINESLERIKVFRAPDQSVKSEVIRRMNGDLDINELVLEVYQERINNKISDKKNILVSYLNKFIFTNYSEVTNLFEGLEPCEGSEFRKKLRVFLNDKITDDEISNLFGMDD